MQSSFPLISRVVLLVVLVAALALASICYLLVGDRTHPATVTTVIVPPGTSFTAAARQVEAAGVAPAWGLRVLERLHGRNGAVTAGKFIFPPHVSVQQAYEALKGSALPLAHWVTVPEGFTAAQIAARLRAEGFNRAQNFARYAASHTIMIDGYRTRSLEGYLFPSTYLIADDADAASIAGVMVAEFRRRLPYDAVRQARRLHQTLPQIVTIASLIEREAKIDGERALMAGIYEHRLALGMPLEVDATLEYAFAAHHSVITAADLAHDTPYNSYRHLGLPPTPIANPGLASLVAAFHPRRTPYLYYVYRGGGRHAFAATLEEHNQNVARYLR